MPKRRETEDLLLSAIDDLNEVLKRLPVEDLAEEISTSTLQTFWRDWPDIAAWAGRAHRTLLLDYKAPASRAKALGNDIGGVG